MEDKIINLEVAMDQSPLIGGLLGLVAKELHELLEIWKRTNGLIGFYIFYRGLSIADAAPRVYLATVESCAFAEVLKSNRLGVDAVKLGKGAHGVSPYRATMIREDVRNDGILKDAPVQELHDVEGGSDDFWIFAQAVGSRNGNVGGCQGRDDAVLALNLVSRLGDQLSGRLLSEHIALALGRGQLIGRVGLAKTKLRMVSCVVVIRWEVVGAITYLSDVQRRLDLGHVVVEPLLQRPDIDGLAHSSGHDVCAQPDFKCVLWFFVLLMSRGAVASLLGLRNPDFPRV